MKRLRLMITFFTRIPISYPYEYKEKDLGEGIIFFPLVGLIIGGILWTMTLLDGYLHRPVMILLIWSLYMIVTGGLHIDGLADTFDGLMSYRPREKMLEIMKDSRVGTFGMLGVLWILVIDLIISYYSSNSLFLIFPMVGRSCAMLAGVISSYARREGGMGKAFIENCTFIKTIVGILWTLVGCFLLERWRGVLGLLITYGFVLLLTDNIKKKLGGMTGDTIGAVIEISQAFFLLATYLIKGLIG